MLIWQLKIFMRAVYSIENFGFELVDAVIANNTQYDGVTTELKNGVEYQWAMIKNNTFIMFQTMSSIKRRYWQSF